MTKEAFETINEGLHEALAVARGEAEPHSIHERGGYTMTPAEYTHYILSQRDLIRDLAEAAEKCANMVDDYMDAFAEEGWPVAGSDKAAVANVRALLEQARKEMER